MKPLRIGMVDLDTSHPAGWIPIIRSMGHEIAGVFDGGTVYSEGYAERFAAEHRIANVYKNLNRMADDVDVAIFHGCNWDLHIERARPFAEAGKSLFFDKPMAGTAQDLQKITAWGRDGIRVTGGSALRYCCEVREWLENHNAEEDWVYAYVGCAVDAFNYGIHAYSLLQGLLGPGLHRVRHLGRSGQRQIELAWEDGRRGLVGIGNNPAYLPFYATITSTKDVTHFQVDSGRLYRAILEATLPYLAGETPPPVPIEELAKAELAAIAAKLSEERGGDWVTLTELPERYSPYDGAQFAEEYKSLKLGNP